MYHAAFLVRLMDVVDDVRRDKFKRLGAIVYAGLR